MSAGVLQSARLASAYQPRSGASASGCSRQKSRSVPRATIRIRQVIMLPRREQAEPVVHARRLARKRTLAHFKKNLAKARAARRRAGRKDKIVQALAAGCAPRIMVLGEGGP